MATALQALTLDQFESQYEREKPYYEFWNGQAIQKSMPNWIHGLLQRILMAALTEAGYKAGSEVKLKIEAGFHPVPDIIATAGPVESPYPTHAVEVVVEILSDDEMSRLLMKCRAYQKWGFQQIYVVDPAARILYRWSEHRLEEVDKMAGHPIAQIWMTLDKELE